LSYQKFKADYLFDGNKILDDTKILITNNNGIVESIVDINEAGDGIETFKGLLAPGFINCHSHLELSHMKNVVETKTGLVDFLLQVTGKRNFPADETAAAMKAADEEMYRNGIVAAGDICNTTDSVKSKQQGKIFYHNFIETLGFSQDKANDIFKNYKQVYDAFCEAGFEKNTSIVPHAPYSVSDALFQLINDFSAGKIISIHNQETQAENELYKTNTGSFHRLYQQLHINTDFFQPSHKNSLPSYLPLLKKPKNILLVHNTFTSQADIDFARLQSDNTSQEIFWCLCPNANLYIENTLPPVELLQKNNCRLVTGTDSYSSNQQLNILEELKTIQNNCPSVTLQEMLQWSTLNGAKALGIENAYGSFEKGKQPGIALIDRIQKNKLSVQSGIQRII
jgi:cytosine/adenosine deaminase-related metal-dependent hydrolase